MNESQQDSKGQDVNPNHIAERSGSISWSTDKMYLLRTRQSMLSMYDGRPCVTGNCQIRKNVYLLRP